MSTRSIGRSAAIIENDRSAATLEFDRFAATLENDRSTATSVNGRRAPAQEVARPAATGETGRPAPTAKKDRSFLCSFTYADGRQCRTPRRNGHPHLCVFHARKQAQALAGNKAGGDIAYHLSGGHVSDYDLSSALGRLFAALAQGHIKPKTAATLACLSRIIVKATHLSQPTACPPPHQESGPSV